MDLSTSINFLCFLIIILIAVVVSPKAKVVIRRFVDFSISAITPLLFWVGIALFVGMICLLIVWAWNKLHELFPKMWSLKEALESFFEIVLFIVLIIAGIFIANFMKKVKDQYFHFLKLENKNSLIIYSIFCLFIWLSLGFILGVVSSVSLIVYYLLFLIFASFIIADSEKTSKSKVYGHLLLMSFFIPAVLSKLGDMRLDSLLKKQ
jgi:hypothetical protein